MDSVDAVMYADVTTPNPYRSGHGAHVDSDSHPSITQDASQQQRDDDLRSSTTESSAQTQPPRRPTTANATAGPSGQAGPTGARFSIRTNVFNARAQLFEVFFHRIALGYARLFPATARRVIEFCFLLKAVLVLMVLVYIHLMFVRSPLTCLDHLRSDRTSKEDSLTDRTGSSSSNEEQWPRYGILRVEVIRNADPHYTLAQSYAKEFYGIELDSVDSGESTPQTDWTTGSGTSSHTAEKDRKTDAIGEEVDQEMEKSSRFGFMDISSTLIYCFRRAWSYITSRTSTTTSTSVGGAILTSDTEDKLATVSDVRTSTESIPLLTETEVNSATAAATRALMLLRDRLTNRALQFFRDAPSRLDALTNPVFPEENYVVEYALEYGFLWLSPATRKRLNISVKLVVLDPEKNTCFGNCFSRFLLDEFLGYNDLLIGSVKRLAATESSKGFVRNVISGEHYRFVSTQMSRSSYLAAAFIMLIFTFSVSVLLRYSSHQLVVVIADILHMLENNATFGVPAAPLMTVILALVAMETIMSEFFGDSITAFYVILIVSVADHYEAVFCHTQISRQYWPRFFYLYHFAFYAYHYRFNGQYSNLALLASWLFILHSMIYFFHHYELPDLLNGWELRQVLLNVHSNNQVVGEVHIHLHTSQISSSNPATGLPATEIVTADSNRLETNSLTNGPSTQVEDSEAGDTPIVNPVGASPVVISEAAAITGAGEDSGEVLPNKSVLTNQPNASTSCGDNVNLSEQHVEEDDNLTVT